MHAELVWRCRGVAADADDREWAEHDGEGSGFSVPGSDADDRQSAINNQQVFIPPVVIDSSPLADHSLFASLIAPGGFLFSYGLPR